MTLCINETFIIRDWGASYQQRHQALTFCLVNLGKTPKSFQILLTLFCIFILLKKQTIKLSENFRRAQTNSVVGEENGDLSFLYLLFSSLANKDWLNGGFAIALRESFFGINCFFNSSFRWFIHEVLNPSLWLLVEQNNLTCCIFISETIVVPISAWFSAWLICFLIQCIMVCCHTFDYNDYDRCIVL